jgi:hypothetical protein
MNIDGYITQRDSGRFVPSIFPDKLFMLVLFLTVCPDNASVVNTLASHATKAPEATLTVFNAISDLSSATNMQ